MLVTISQLLESGIIVHGESEYGFYIGYVVAPGYALKDSEGHDVYYIQQLTEQGERDVTVLIRSDGSDPLSVPNGKWNEEKMCVEMPPFEVRVYKEITVI